MKSEEYILKRSVRAKHIMIVSITVVFLAGFIDSSMWVWGALFLGIPAILISGGLILSMLHYHNVGADVEFIKHNNRITIVGIIAIITWLGLLFTNFSIPIM